MEQQNLTIKKITGKIKLLTGLHIGAGSETIEIGGIDNPVIKDPRTGLPYIPGSSIKGKMRSLLETSEKKFGGKDKDKNGPCNCGKIDCLICKVFGNTNKDSKTGITRAVFRDCFLDDESIRMLNERNLTATEAKMENTIDRIRGTAYNPRTTERVIAGLSFDFEIALRILSGDDEKQIKEFIKKGLNLLQMDALGGSGSRGYGKIKFDKLMYDGKNMEIAENAQ
ncbi:MAG: type III-A CRISPR-associated RAMP protein Csm3 [Spirochaetes bacterium]|nr:type III-A CRISPR-associated RAMP protein Csm3 [Spirochaetota bacterium]